MPNFAFHVMQYFMHKHGVHYGILPSKMTVFTATASKSSQRLGTLHKLMFAERRLLLMLPSSTFLVVIIMTNNVPPKLREALFLVSGNITLKKLPQIDFTQSCQCCEIGNNPFRYRALSCCSSCGQYRDWLFGIFLTSCAAPSTKVLLKCRTSFFAQRTRTARTVSLTISLSFVLT